MIQTYKQELRKRAQKNFIFWMVVLLFTAFLYFFFQGYYPNYRELFHPSEESKKSFLKPFGIIDIHVFPSPDSILVNDSGYNNSSRTIFDLGTYMVQIQKEGYIHLTLPIEITQKNPFYSSTFNLLRLPKYISTGLTFNHIEKVASVYFVGSSSKNLLILDKNRQVLKPLVSPYIYLGSSYFRGDDSTLFSYEYTTDKFTQVLSKETGKPLLCKEWKIYGGTPFCPDTRKFIDSHGIDVSEKILAANHSIVTTDTYIYNQDEKNTDWKYYEYRNRAIHAPTTLFHINKIPFVLENGWVIPIDPTTSSSGSNLPKLPLDQITAIKEFSNTETVFIGTKDKTGMFTLIEGDKQWSGVFDTSDMTDMQVEKVGGVYIFFSKQGAYIYYRGAQDMFKILKDPVIAIIDSIIYFTRDGKTYSIDLLRK